MTGIKCPHCRSSLALDQIGIHLKKFCTAAKTDAQREASVRKFNLLYSDMQSHARGEITIEELQAAADKIFLER